jgi:hypothetical protein
LILPNIRPLVTKSYWQTIKLFLLGGRMIANKLLPNRLVLPSILCDNFTWFVETVFETRNNTIRQPGIIP